VLLVPFQTQPGSLLNVGSWSVQATNRGTLLTASLASTFKAWHCTELVSLCSWPCAMPSSALPVLSSLLSTASLPLAVVCSKREVAEAPVAALRAESCALLRCEV
jgi:hypothetical protein